MVTLLLFVSLAFGGEPMKAGAVLKQDSFVFSLDEARDIKSRLEELDNLKLQITEYEKLDVSLKSQISILEETSKLKDRQLADFIELKKMTDARLEKVEKQQEKQARFNRVENGLFLLGGIGLTIGSVLLADKIDDVVEIK